LLCLCKEPAEPASEIGIPIRKLNPTIVALRAAGCSRYGAQRSAPLAVPALMLGLVGRVVLVRRLLQHAFGKSTHASLRMYPLHETPPWTDCDTPPEQVPTFTGRDHPLRRWGSLARDLPPPLSPPSRRSSVLHRDARPHHPHLKSVGPRRGLLTVLPQPLQSKAAAR
jgi:hypothetical protein